MSEVSLATHHVMQANKGKNTKPELKVREGLREAGLSGLDAVDQWAAGFVQGDVFRSCARSVRSAATPQLQTMVEMPVCAGEPCIMIVDIWGNRRFYLPRRRY